MEIIKTPDEYIKVIQNHGTVYQLGEEVEVADWKGSTQKVLKPTAQWHFKFNPSKRFVLSRQGDMNVMIQGEVNYRTELGTPKPVTRKSHRISSINPVPLSVNILVKQDKMVAVLKLLEKHYGNDWRLQEDFKFYVNLELKEPGDVENTEECVPIEEADTLSV